ncbi:hypothetical protein AAF695_05625 [Aerococcus viridans]
MIKQCTICGNDFEATTNNAKYCSDACKKKGRKLSQREWRANHKGYFKEKMIAYRKKKNNS